MENTHLGGLGILIVIRFSTVPIHGDGAGTIIKSYGRGLGRKPSAPKRALSKRDAKTRIISWRKQARQKVLPDGRLASPVEDGNPPTCNEIPFSLVLMKDM